MEKEILEATRICVINAKKATWRENKSEAIRWLDMAKNLLDMGYRGPENLRDDWPHARPGPSWHGWLG